MKKVSKLSIITLLFLLLAVFLTNCGSGGGGGDSGSSTTTSATEPAETPAPGSIKKWTTLVYINADNNLEGAGIDDINEMEIVGSTSDINVVVQIDRISGYDTSNGNWTGAKRYYIQQDSDINTVNSSLVQDLGEINMGDHQSLIDFAKWGINNYPADHYMLVVWNHGGGFRYNEVSVHARDISWDDTNGCDSITIPELAEAAASIKSHIGRNIDILGMDACLMAMAEIAYELKDSADYMVGSEETEPGDGWPYDYFLQRLSANPDASAELFASWIVQDYITSYGSTSVTQSSLALSHAATLTGAVNDLAQAMIDGIGDAGQGGAIQSELRTILNNTENYYSTDYRDLYDFADQVSNGSAMTTDIVNAANAVRTAVTAAVSENGTVGSAYANSYGLSIWLPNSSQFSTYLTKYSELSFADDTVWDEFLSSLWTAAMRIELTWGAQPRDLDAHLWDANGNHLYFNNPSINGASISQDDEDGFGPEEVQINRFYTGSASYAFAVKAVAGFESSETVTVKVYEGSNTVPSYTFTKAGFYISTGLWWHVLNIDPATQGVTYVNSEQSSSPRVNDSVEKIGVEKDDMLDE